MLENEKVPDVSGWPTITVVPGLSFRSVRGRLRRRLWSCGMLVSLGVGPIAASSLEIRDPAGRPLPEAPFKIFALPVSTSLVSDFGTLILQGETDAAGRLPSPLPRLGTLLVVVDHPAFAPFVAELEATTVQVRLSLGDRVEGSVTVPSGRVRGRVCARWETAIPAWKPTFRFERCAEIDEGGRWAIRGLGGASILLTAEAAGFLPATASWRPGAKPVALALSPGHLVTGRLVDPAGQAVREARLEAVGAAPAEADPGGGFGIALPTLPAKVTIRAPGFRPRQIEVPAAPKQDSLAVRLEWGQQLKGILLDGDGRPLGKASLSAARWNPQVEGWTPEVFDLDPAADGSFEIDLPHSGEYRLRFRAEGLRSDPFPRQWIAAGAVLDLGVVTFDAGAGVRCRVVDEAEGEPIAGVEARLVGRGTGLLAQLLEDGAPVVASDANGELYVTGVEAGAYRLRLRHDRYASVSRTLDLERGEIHDCGEVALAQPIEITGRVVTRDGRPLPGARVRFFEPPADGLEPMADVTAGSDGRYGGVRLSRGDYVVWVDHERRLLSQSYTLERPGKDRRAEVDLVIPGVRLVLHLTRGGQPIEGGGSILLTSDLDLAESRLKMQFQSSAEGGERQMLGQSDRPQVATVRQDGSAEIADAPAGPARLELIEPDGTAVTRRLLVPDEPFAELTVELGGTALTGRLVDGETEAGLAGRLEVVDDGGRIVASVGSEVDGGFQVEDLAPGRYALRASAESYSPAIERVELKPGNGASVVLSLRPGGAGAVSVHFERPDGGPAAGLVSHLLDGTGRLTGACVADSTGRCRHPDVPPGTYALAWSDPVVGAGGATPVVTRPEEQTDFEHRLQLGGALALRCLSCAEAGLEGLAVVSASGIRLTPYLEGVAPALRFGADGLLALGRLNAGAYFVRVRAAGRESQHGIEVRPGEGMTINLDLDFESRAPAAGAGSEP